jgi:chromosome segregation ATPase
LQAAEQKEHVEYDAEFQKSLANGGVETAEMTKEKKEWFEAQTDLATAKAQLANVDEVLTVTQAQMSNLQQKTLLLQTLGAREEALLERVFKGAYGSALEAKLEADLFVKEEALERNDDAFEKNARAIDQLRCAAADAINERCCWHNLIFLFVASGLLRVSSALTHLSG